MPPAIPFSDLALARRLERAEANAGARFVEARAGLFPESGACWTEVAGTFAMFDGPDSPVTQTFGLGLFQDVTSAGLSALEEFFRQRGAPVFHEVSPLAGLPLAATLAGRGYRPAEFTSVMYRSLGDEFPAPAQSAPHMRVRPVREGEEDLWARTAACGWSDSPELTEFLLNIGRVNARRAGAVSFFAEFEGRPVATGVLAVSENVGLLAGACTVPEARKQGAQLALLESRLRCAAEQGCDIAMMCAQPGSASQRNAERHGFRIAYTRIKWGLIRPA